MNHLGGIGIAWFMLSGFPGVLPEELHLWTTTQEQRDLKLLQVKIASSAATWYYGSALTK